MDNKREFFRLELKDEDVTVIHPGGKEAAMIKDISATGLSFEAHYEFVFEWAILLFQVNKIKFERKALFVRRNGLASGKYFYAVRFINFDEEERKKLFQAIMQEQAKKLGNG
ncbi:PilZ domain-containing protein [Priestia sp. SB1]|uniref:PilZ domain-containing protein n=1 Tax=Priestia aryabhattai TaxID=412384 RepID=A0AAX6NF55_PRIAR|nr:PilZ domain-containing protein [Priestia aryabhattai]MDU9694135.1 PilZ domain-containing protein [Priestia aryabhattai]